MGIYEIEDINYEYIELVYKILKIKNYNTCSNNERFYTYYLILIELNNFDEITTINKIREEISQGESIHKTFVNIVKNDTTDILTIFKNTINMFEEEDFTSVFFNF